MPTRKPAKRLMAKPIGMFIAENNLSVRLWKGLIRAGIYILGDLRNKSVNDLMHIRNFGSVSMIGLVEALAKYGIELKLDPNQSLPSNFNRKYNRPADW